MRAPARILLLCSLLLLPAIALRPGVAAAAGGDLTAQTTVATLNLTPNHHATTAAIFTPGELIAFWFDVPGGGAGPLSLASTGSVHAQGDGTLDITIAGDDWNSIARSATDLVAYGLSSQVAAVAPLNPPAGLDVSLHLDANHHLSTAAIFSPNEQVVFWYNRSDFSAADFMPTPDTINADGNGVLNVTIGAAQWASLPADVTSIVAHGLYSNVQTVYVFPRQ